MKVTSNIKERYTKDTHKTSVGNLQEFSTKANSFQLQNSSYIMTCLQDGKRLKEGFPLPSPSDKYISSKENT